MMSFFFQIEIIEILWRCYQVLYRSIWIHDMTDWYLSLRLKCHDAAMISRKKLKFILSYLSYKQYSDKDKKITHSFQYSLKYEIKWTLECLFKSGNSRDLFYLYMCKCFNSIWDAERMNKTSWIDSDKYSGNDKNFKMCPNYNNIHHKWLV